MSQKLGRSDGVRHTEIRGRAWEVEGKANAKSLTQQCARCVQTTAGRPKLSTWRIWKIRKYAFQVTPLGNMELSIDLFTK